MSGGEANSCVDWLVNNALKLPLGLKMDRMGVAWSGRFRVSLAQLVEPPMYPKKQKRCVQ